MAIRLLRGVLQLCYNWWPPNDHENGYTIQNIRYTILQLLAWLDEYLKPLLHYATAQNLMNTCSKNYTLSWGALSKSHCAWLRWPNNNMRTAAHLLVFSPGNES